MHSSHRTGWPHRDRRADIPGWFTDAHLDATLPSGDRAMIRDEQVGALAAREGCGALRDPLPVGLRPIIDDDRPTDESP